jgi:hypothetical protein
MPVYANGIKTDAANAKSRPKRRLFAGNSEGD